MKRIVYVNGSFLREDLANISIFDRGFLFSDAVYEVTGVINSKLIDNHNHLKRLRSSLNFLDINIDITDQEIEKAQRKLIEKNRLVNGIIYLQISRGSEDRDFLYSQNIKPTIVIFTQSKNFFEDPKVLKGISVITQEDQRWKFRNIKTTSLLASVLVKNEARKKGADDAWYIEDGFVTEGAASNAFIIMPDNTILTHPLSSSILPGTTRSAVFEIAKLLGFIIEERAFSLEEAKQAKEAFITGAGTLVIPVIQIDQTIIGTGQPGDITLKIREKYLRGALV